MFRKDKENFFIDNKIYFIRCIIFRVFKLIVIFNVEFYDFFILL